jgi:GntR family transcriptional regulator, phosphonate transport system regulatory protein
MTEISFHRLPRWRAIEETLKREIMDGQFGPSRRLPADTAIAARFEVSRMTARKALAGLQQQGIIRIEHGRGAFVEGDVVDYRILQKVTFTQSVAANNKMPSRDLLGANLMDAPPWVCDALEVSEATPVLAITLLGKADGRPLALSTSYLEYDRFPDFTDLLGPRADVDAAWDALSITLRPGWAKLVARMPKNDEARLLDQSASRPVIEKRAIDTDNEGRPAWCHVTCYAADRIQLVFDPHEQGVPR